MPAVIDRRETKPTAPPALVGRLRGFESGAREIDDAPMRVSGSLPGWLRGRLLLNGPALWDLPNGRYEHWFDGLAMLHGIKIDGADGSARYRSRFLHSEDYLRSIALGAPALGAFDTPKHDGWFTRVVSPRNTDNGAVVMARIGEDWIATTETPMVTEFDAPTLGTIGRARFDDDLHIDLMAAHGFTDAGGNWWNVGIQLGPKSTYRLFRVAAGTRRREPRGEIKVAHAGYLHAFARSQRHALVWECALRAQPLSLRFSARPYIRAFRWDADSGSMVHAIDLDDGTVRSWALPPMFCFHAVQAIEEGEEIVVELIVYEDASVVDDLRLTPLRAGAPQQTLPQLLRYRLRPGRADALPEPVAAGIELPQIHPARCGTRSASCMWGSGLDPERRQSFLDRTVRLDLRSGERRVWQRPGAVQLEPLFVPRPGSTVEDDGVLLVPTLAERDAGGVIGVLDARSMENLATLEAPQVIPFGFHAAFDAA